MFSQMQALITLVAKKGPVKVYPCQAFFMSRNIILALSWWRTMR